MPAQSPVAVVGWQECEIRAERDEFDCQGQWDDRQLGGERGRVYWTHRASGATR